MDYSSTTTVACTVDAGVLHVELDRPKALNAITKAMIEELGRVCSFASADPNIRVLVISARGKMFSAGLDLADAGLMQGGDKDTVDMLADVSTQGTASTDSAPRAWAARIELLRWQDAISAFETCSKPVIAVVHGGCVGGGIDLICAADIRVCTTDSWFSLKEVDIGIAADLGTLQRLPKIIGNESLVRDMAFTARKVDATEMKEAGLVSGVFKGKTSALEHALDKAKLIAAKSPIAVVSTKEIIKYARDHSVEDGLKYVAAWNMSMSKTADTPQAILAMKEKREKIQFSKL